MSADAPKDHAEDPEAITAVHLPVGTPVQFTKLDSAGKAALAAPSIVGGFVHAAVGTCGYVYHPDCEVSVATDLPGNVLYTAKTSPIAAVVLRDGMYYVHTKSGSVYAVIVRGGDPIIAPKDLVPPPAENADERSVAGHAVEKVQDGRWKWLGAIRKALGGE